jgi:hypothetical protein
VGRTQTRDCTDDYVRLNVRWCKRHGLLWPQWSRIVEWSKRGERFAWIFAGTAEHHITLLYRTRRVAGEWRDRNHPVAVEWTPCPVWSGSSDVSPTPCESSVFELSLVAVTMTYAHGCLSDDRLLNRHARSRCVLI